ncbi:hypothetical protein [Mycobacterium sp. M26]|uniref:hypothetical protein n=1 Tax=Mycobacterium sp. M26 TaxID=1762962 RepID=UPI000A82365D|nr:hypothetical protein [Mycobacterium sp. M26]
MSRATMADTASALPRAPLFGIGACRVGTEVRDFEIGWPEIERDTAWAASLLEASGVRSGDRALITLPNWELPWGNPVIRALRDRGVVYLPAEHYSWDARRVAHLVDSMRPRIFIGLCAETLDGLAGLGRDATELLGGIELVWARHDALGRLAEMGVTAMPFVPLGPALAMGTPGADAVVNADEWAPGAVEGELLVSTIGDRAHTFTDIRTGIKGRWGAQTPLGVSVTFDL